MFKKTKIIATISDRKCEVEFIRLLSEKDNVVILAGSFGPKHGPSFIEISQISNILA